MRNQIDFCEARLVHIPAVRLHGNVVLEQIARLGRAINVPPPLRLLRLEWAVHLPRADPQKLLRDLRRERKCLRIHGNHCGNSAFSCTDEGYPAASQTAVSTAWLSWL